MRDFYTILLAERGSVTYGIAITPEEAQAHGIKPSDADYMRIVMAPLERILSVRDLPEAANYKEPHDEEVHELRHFIRLCTKANPNILECLAVDEKHLKVLTEEGRRLRENIHIFLNKRPVRAAYLGYTQQQVKRYLLPESGGTTAERRKLATRLGYDGKAAAHAVRLLIQGTGILETGKLQVHLGEYAPFVKDIRLCKFSKEEVLGFIAEWEERLKAAYDKSPLPEEPNPDEIDALYRSVLSLRYPFLSDFSQDERSCD